jgi:hypothetical protein
VASSPVETDEGSRGALGGAAALVAESEERVFERRVRSSKARERERGLETNFGVTVYEEITKHAGVRRIPELSRRLRPNRTNRRARRSKSIENARIFASSMRYGSGDAEPTEHRLIALNPARQSRLDDVQRTPSYRRHDRSEIGAFGPHQAQDVLDRGFF